MKILIPVDETNRYLSVLEFVKCLGLKNVDVRFFHSVAPITAYDTTYVSVAAIQGATLTELDRGDAHRRLENACKQASLKGFAATWDIGDGYPAQAIISAAEEYQPDLVALPAMPKKPLERFLSGSTSLNLASNYEGDLLIVRSGEMPKEKMTVVYATDHSPMASECLEKLLSWHAEGIAHVEVLNAYQLVGHETVVAGKTETLSPDEVDGVIRSLLSEKTEKVVAQFKRVGLHAHGRCVEKPIADAISETMSSTAGNLLVLSSSGHSLWETLVKGSTTMKEIANDPYSILVLRPKKRAAPTSTPETVEIPV